MSRSSSSLASYGTRRQRAPAPCGPSGTPPRARSWTAQLEHTLDRLALLYGHGTYEALTTTEIVETAVENEQRLAAALDEPDATAATARARALVDAARRGVRLHVREPADSVRLYRGVYVTPLRPELERTLWAREEPFLRWGDGAVLILDEDELAAVRADGGEVRVLFLDADELLDMDFRGDRPALDAELEQRRAVARAAPERGRGFAGPVRAAAAARAEHRAPQSPRPPGGRPSVRA